MIVPHSRERSAIPAELEEELASVAEAGGCELVHAEFKGNRLRLILDHLDGITLDQCGKFSKEASAILDVHDFGRSNYLLEVSSPGLDRQLFRSEDFRRFVDHNIRVRFEEADSRRKRTVIGKLDDFDEQTGITVIERSSGEPLVIPLLSIEVARLEIEN